ncbi:MAG: Fur family transcriptional regulator [Acidimicrobiales bacterium]
MPNGEPADPTALLRERGVQVTAQRLAVLRAVSAQPHATTEEIEDLVRGEIGAVSRQAVYDALGVLTEKQLIRRIQPARSAARYEDRIDDNHHHLVCRGCGITVDVDCAVGARPCLEAAENHGFEIDEAEVIYWGTCPDCRRADESPRTAPSNDRNEKVNG